MKEKILRALNDSQGYVSGQELCSQLGVSRTAIWKIINQLKDEGYVIESLPRKGYRIIEHPDRITDLEVNNYLSTKWAGKTIYYKERTGSTNTDAAMYAEKGAPEGTLVIAEEQGSGKGRRGRTWITPAGSAIAMSLILRPEIEPANASMLTLVMGLAVAYACKDVCKVETGIKWPNDIVVDGKKICGILTEMNCEIHYINYLVIGTGINTSVDKFPPELKDVAISLHKIMKQKPNRAALIAACMKRFEEFYERFLQTQDFSLLLDEYHALLIGINQPVRVLSPGNEYTGISRGINSKGELLVERENGSIETVYAGEVSVRGVYGYV